jgi:hypothetical protein
MRTFLSSWACVFDKETDRKNSAARRKIAVAISIFGCDLVFMVFLRCGGARWFVRLLAEAYIDEAMGGALGGHLCPGWVLSMHAIQKSVTRRRLGSPG